MDSESYISEIEKTLKSHIFYSRKYLYEVIGEEIDALIDNLTIKDISLEIVSFDKFAINESIYDNKLFLEFILYLVYLETDELYEEDEDLEALYELYLDGCGRIGTLGKYLSSIKSIKKSIDEYLNEKGNVLFLGWYEKTFKNRLDVIFVRIKDK